MEKQNKMPNDKVLAMISELAAEKVRDQLDFNFNELVHEAIGDAILEVIGDILDTDSDAYTDMLMELSSSIAVVSTY